MSVKERLLLFIQSLDISQRYFGRKVGLSSSYISNMVNSIQPDKLEKIVRCYPQLSPGWLMTGEGEMLKPGYIKKDQEETLVKLVPLLPISAEGGLLNHFSDAIMLKDCKMVQPHVDDAQFAMFITGDSMAPEYPAGSMIFIKRVNEKSFIEWGRVYVLDTCNGSIIKKLMPLDSGDKDRIKCVSMNPEYPSFEVPFEDIYGIYRVRACTSLK